jgi:hypothetical protein
MRRTRMNKPIVLIVVSKSLAIARFFLSSKKVGGIMNLYEVNVEGLVKRRIIVEADSQSEADDLAKEEFCLLVGADSSQIEEDV